MVMSYFQRVRPQCKVQSFYTVLEAMGCYYHFCPCQDARPCLTEEEIQRCIRKRELDELRKQCIQEKDYNVIEMYECDWWKKYKTDNIVKQHLRESFPYKMPLREKRLLEVIKSGSLFVYVQCVIEVPENIKLLPTFHPSSRRLMLVMMTFFRLPKNVPRKKDL